MGTTYANRGVTYGDTLWDFDGQEIFKRAVHGMSEAAADVLARAGHARRPTSTSSCRTRRTCASSSSSPSAVGVADGPRVPHRAQRYGNMSAATVPVALVDALEEGRVAPDALMLMPAFGGGLTWCAHLVRWGERTTPLDAADVDLPPCDAVGARDGAARCMREQGRQGALDARGSTPSAFPRSGVARPARRPGPPANAARRGSRGSPRYEVTSLRCACTLIRMPSPMNSDTSAVPP